MSRLSDILIRVRDTLNDQKKERWSDAVLVRYLSIGQNDIGIQARLFKATVQIQLVAGQSIYDLPDNLIALRQVIYKGEPLDLVSTNFMDSQSGVGRTLRKSTTTNYYSRQSGVTDSWRDQSTEDGDLDYAIFDYAEEKQLRVYPRPFNDDLEVEATFDSVYGVMDTLTDITVSPIYGVVGTLTDTEIELINQDQFGVVVETQDSVLLTVHYTKAPPVLTDPNDNLSVDFMWDTALKFWTAGQALRADLTAQNRAYGSEELELYARELAVIQELGARDNVTTNHHQTFYRGLG